ncbi:hypothetical protein BD769DRAFT_1638213 [Suillus cothurnatus]|nr:hypothetical protein BD769DRAFT_1638213 [Suillus cothurnatus]
MPCTALITVHLQKEQSKQGPRAYDLRLGEWPVPPIQLILTGSWGVTGIAAPDPTSYMISICMTYSFSVKILKRIQADTAVGNSPLWSESGYLRHSSMPRTSSFAIKVLDGLYVFIEFVFDQDIAERRTLQYWNFKIEISNHIKGNALARQWSYLEGLKPGFLTQDPAALHDPNVTTGGTIS